MAEFLRLVAFSDALTTRHDRKGAPWLAAARPRQPWPEHFPGQEARIAWLFAHRNRDCPRHGLTRGALTLVTGAR